MDEGGGALQGLDQVGLQGVLQQGSHSPFRLQIVGGHRPAVVGVGHDNAAQLLLQVHQAGGQTQHGHDLAGHRDVKAVLPGYALHPAAQAVYNVAQLPVVHVHHPLPGDLLDVDAQGVALLNVVVQHSGQQVVGRANGVEVAGEVEVDVLHGDHLGIPAASGPSFDAEHRAQRGLPQSGDGLLANLAQAVGQTHRRGGLSLAGGGGGDGGHQDQLAVLRLYLIQQLVIHFGLVPAIVLQILLRNASRLCDLLDGLHLGALGNFDVSQHVQIPPSS